MTGHVGASTFTLRPLTCGVSDALRWRAGAVHVVGAQVEGVAGVGLEVADGSLSVVNDDELQLGATCRQTDRQRVHVTHPLPQHIQVLHNITYDCVLVINSQG